LNECKASTSGKSEEDAKFLSQARRDEMGVRAREREQKTDRRPEVNNYQRMGFILAVMILSLMALFPPRKPAPQANTANFAASRGFLFSPNINRATRRLEFSDGSSGESTEYVEIDSGRLLAEALLVFTACGLWYMCTSSFKDRAE
jgi:hypothetical protein